MAVIVDQFIYENEEALKHMPGFERLVSDLDTKFGQGGSPEIINALAAKLILSHHYDGATDQPMAKLFKQFCINNLEFPGGYANAN